METTLTIETCRPRQVNRTRGPWSWLGDLVRGFAAVRVRPMPDRGEAVAARRLVLGGKVVVLERPSTD